jgi:hypothetical protein
VAAAVLGFSGDPLRQWQVRACQNPSTTQWLERARGKLLPVDDFSLREGAHRPSMTPADRTPHGRDCCSTRRLVAFLARRRAVVAARAGMRQFQRKLR